MWVWGIAIWGVACKGVGAGCYITQCAKSFGSSKKVEWQEKKIFSCHKNHIQALLKARTLAPILPRLNYILTFNFWFKVTNLSLRKNRPLVELH